MKMSESKFNDGRVIRSNETTLTLVEIRMLMANLESGENDVNDLRKLTSIANKIEEVLGEYGQRVEANLIDARKKLRESSNNPEFANIVNAAVSAAIENLDETLGAELAPDIILSMTEWQWALDRWRRNSKFVGIKQIREKLLRIDDALANAKGIRLIGKSVWVKGEPAPGGLSMVEKSQEASG
jgi:hypothetical protein